MSCSHGPGAYRTWLTDWRDLVCPPQLVLVMDFWVEGEGFLVPQLHLGLLL